MSYITFTLFVYTQYLRQHSNWLRALISPIVRTVNKSPDLLAGFDLFRTLSITQVKARLGRQPGDVLLVRFSNRDFCLADFMEGIYEVLELIKELYSFWTRKLFN